MKLLLTLFLLIISSAAFSKTFATFNLLIVNSTKDTFTAECYGGRGENKVKFYFDSNWEHSQTELITLEPGEKATFHIGAYTKRTFSIPRIYSSSPYISNKSYFSLVLNKISDNKTVSSSVKTIWQGGDGDFDPDEQNTRFYYYRYTGSFVIKSTTSTGKKADFSLFGSSHFGSHKYSSKFILTSDELWDKDAGYYLVEIQPSETKSDETGKVKLYPPALPKITQAKYEE